MSVSQGNFSSGPNGLNLVAWAFFTNAGTIIKGVGIASVSHFGTGIFKVTLSAAQPSTDYFIDVKANGTGGAMGTNANPSSTTIFEVDTFTSTGGTAFQAADMIRAYVAVYA